MKIIDKETKKSDLLKKSEYVMDDVFIKAVVDVSRELVAIDAELHADLEKLLLENGSKQEDLWGINLYPDLEGDDFVEFDSMINVRPRQNNRSRDVEDKKTREKIKKVVAKWLN